MLLEHPAVVGEEQLEAEAQSQDDREPQHRAEHQRRQHGLALRAQGHVQTARGGGGTEHLVIMLYFYLFVHFLYFLCSQAVLLFFSY